MKILKVSILYFCLFGFLIVFGQQTIEYGQTLTGVISTDGEVDIFQFDGTEGDTIFLLLTENSSYAWLEPHLELFNPQGTRIRNVADGSQVKTSISLPMSGSYTIFVSDNEGDDTGNYGLFIQRYINPGYATRINYGQTLTGSISTDGEVDTYKFAGNEGDKVILRLTENSSYAWLEPRVELYIPGYDTLLASGDGAQAAITYTLPVTDTCVIFVRDSYPGDDTGNYGLFIQHLVNPGYANVIEYGETLTGGISTDGEVDAYTFLGAEGDSVIIRLTENSSFAWLEPFLELYDPSGERITMHSHGSQAEISLRLTKFGQYTILASDSYPGDDTGNYSIFIFGFMSSPILAWPSSLDFGTVNINNTVVDSICIFNRGASTVNIDSITISGNDKENFEMISTQIFSLEPGDSQYVLINFTPDNAADFNSIFNVYSSGGNIAVNLSGSGYGTVINYPPELISSSMDTAYTGILFEYVAQAVDPEDSVVTYTFENYPGWLVPSVSHISGTPLSGAQDTSFMVIASDGELTDTLIVTLIVIDNITAITDMYSEIPRVFSLNQNYPNPFNPVTTISYGLPKNSDVSITIYNISGQKVIELFRGKQTAGIHTISWNAAHVSSGMYFIKMQTKDFVAIKKCILIK